MQKQRSGSSKRASPEWEISAACWNKFSFIAASQILKSFSFSAYSTTGNIVEQSAGFYSRSYKDGCRLNFVSPQQIKQKEPVPAIGQRPSVIDYRDLPEIFICSIC
jgi:hypothetical protein